MEFFLKPYDILTPSLTKGRSLTIMRTRKNFLLPALLLLACTLVVTKTAHASIRTADVLVSDSGSDNSLNGSNTGRKIVGAPNGDIYVVYHSPTQGIRFARSITAGASFTPSIAIDDANTDVEITVDGEGILYITWVKDSVIMLTRSTDRGESFDEPVEIAETLSASVHIATATPYVYIIEREGVHLLSNAHKGVGEFTSTVVDQPRIFSDVQADPLTGYVYVQTDDPNVLYFVSTNHGASFNPSIQPGADIYYSTAAFSTSETKKYLYVAGGMNSGIHSAALRINVNDNSIFNMPMATMPSQTNRSLAADNLGNVVNGFFDGTSLSFEASGDYGENFTPAVAVAQGNFLSVAINPVNHDVLVLYDKAGSIYLSTYKNVLRTTLAPEPVPAGNTSGASNVDPAIFAPPRIADISFSLNDGQAATASPNATLRITAGADVRSMAISRNADFAGTSLQPISSPLVWKLCDDCQNGQTYTVFLKLYTAHGQSLLLSRSIRYDTGTALTMPSVSETKEVAPTAKPAPALFQTDLRLSSSGADVIRLQKYLNTHGFIIAKKGPGSPGNEIGLFGPATRNAVMRLQAANASEILAPFGLLKPSGIFGASTRKYVNNHP